MPSKSKKQHNLMAMACKDPKFAKEHGIDQKVACEFIEADKKANEEAKKNNKPPIYADW